MGMAIEFTKSSIQKEARRSLFLLAALCLLPAALGWAQQPTGASQTKPPAAQPPETAAPSGEDAVLPGDWAPELLWAILSSPNPTASDALYRAAFAAGPGIVPQLEAALKDDRTAEFAAQSLAFIGGEKALQALFKLQDDKRDLNLRRFYYGALGEYDSPQATDTLFSVIDHSDSEPDRTVTEAAILALTVRTDPKILPRIREAENKVHDVVIHDDLDNAAAVIESRERYLASPEGQKAGGSINAAVHTYFIAAFEPPPAAPKTPAAAPEKPPVKVEVRHLVFSPDQMRALARVAFEDPSAIAYYDMVLQKRLGDWTLASVWLGTEEEKPVPAPKP
jgi:hypothetical protein